MAVYQIYYFSKKVNPYDFHDNDVKRNLFK